MISEPLEELGNDLPAISMAGAHQDGETNERLPVLTCKELVNGDYRVDYLVDGVAVRGQPGIVGGPEKSLKTSICIDFGLSLATGRPFLGKFRVSEPRRVLFCSGESGLCTLKNTSLEVSAAKGIDLQSVDGLLWSGALPNLSRSAELGKLLATITRSGVECLIIDPVYLALPTNDPWNLFAQGELLRDISAGCLEAGATLVLVHHVKKNRTDRNAPPQLTDLSGSGFAEFARWWVLLSRREEYVPPCAHQLWLSTGGSAGHSGAWALDVEQGEYQHHRRRQWRITLETASEARRKAAEVKKASRNCQSAAAVEAAKRAITETLLNVPGHADTLDRIKRAARTKGHAFQAALDEMTQGGCLTACRITRGNGREYDGFQLSRSGPL